MTPDQNEVGDGIVKAMLESGRAVFLKSYTGEASGPKCLVIVSHVFAGHFCDSSFTTIGDLDIASVAMPPLCAGSGTPPPFAMEAVWSGKALHDPTKFLGHLSGCELMSALGLFSDNWLRAMADAAFHHCINAQKQLRSRGGGDCNVLQAARSLFWSVCDLSSSLAFMKQSLKSHSCVPYKAGIGAFMLSDLAKSGDILLPGAWDMWARDRKLVTKKRVTELLAEWVPMLYSRMGFDDGECGGLECRPTEEEVSKIVLEQQAKEEPAKNIPEKC